MKQSIKATPVKLTAKQKAFCDHFLVTLNASEASRLAGYKSRANQAGVENMSKPVIKEYLGSKMAETTQKLDISREKILSMLMEEAQNPDNQSNVRVAALSHLGRFTLGELNRSEVNGAIAFKWEDDSDTADVGVLSTDINDNKLIESNS